MRIHNILLIILAEFALVSSLSEAARAKCCGALPSHVSLNSRFAFKGELHGHQACKTAGGVQCSAMEAECNRASGIWVGKPELPLWNWYISPQSMFNIACKSNRGIPPSGSIPLRDSKPKSVEALIDDLVGDSDDQREVGNKATLVELSKRGFDAIPSLIEHMNDRRFTKCTRGPLGKDPFRVGDYCIVLLNELLGDTQVFTTSPEEALFVYGRAQLIGEERWFLDYAMKMVKNEDATISYWPPNMTIIRAIGAKYPDRLVPLYQTALYKLPSFSSGAFVRGGFEEIILDSHLSRDRKTALLSEGAIHPLFEHRIPALEALAYIDKPTFCRLLIKTLKSYPLVGDLDRERSMVRLVGMTRNKDVWEALSSLTMRLSPIQQWRIISSVDDWTDPNLSSIRSQSIRFLLLYLSHDEIGRLATEKLSQYFEMHDAYMGISGEIALRKFQMQLKEKAYEDLQKNKE
ncbi:MAG TPA: hypothetical protein VN641_11715 [Urbifossiella sp.]|nr:hypothetical protein [Urbifossiella sp.]